MGSSVIFPLTNDTVGSICLILMARRLSDIIYRLLSVNYADDDIGATLYSSEFLHKITPSRMLTSKLVPKPGAPIILLRTANPSQGLFNGTRCLLLGAMFNVLYV